MDHLEIPQDIVDNIVDQLRGFDDALKSCSVVSRSFVLPCRQNLFAVIELDSIEKTQRLLSLLISHPEFSILIRHLTIALLASPAAKSFQDVCDWFENDSNELVSLFKTVPRLRYFAWGSLYSGQLYWDDLSDNLKSSLLALFHSPLLTTIKIHGLAQAHSPSLSRGVFPNVKHLALRHVCFNQIRGSVEPVGEIVLPNLEVLEVTAVMFPQSIVSNLRHLLIGSDHGQTVAFSWSVIQSSTKSLERIFWNCGSQLSPLIDLGVLENLQFLTFNLLEQPLGGVVKRLMDKRVTRHLKELTISLQTVTEQDEHYIATLETLAEFEGWKVLDQALSTVATLQMVVINLDLTIPYQGVTRGLVQPWVQRWLPLLCGRGILSVACGSIEVLETVVWPAGDWH